jgi:hypothetical protein
VYDVTRLEGNIGGTFEGRRKNWWGGGVCRTPFRFLVIIKGTKRKEIPEQAVEAPRFQENRHMKVVRLSVLRTGRLYPQEVFLVLISVRG